MSYELICYYGALYLSYSWFCLTMIFILSGLGGMPVQDVVLDVVL
jgi:hypothetical protein